MTDITCPLVTIGIPTYNRANRSLRLALKSATDQTYANIEIIVSDNCSDDNTKSVVREFSDPRIRYFRQPCNIGANRNYNFCLEQAKGSYFLLLHDDDMIDYDFVDTCMNAIRNRNTVGIIRTGTRLINASGDVLRAFPNRVDNLSTSDFILGWMEGKTSIYCCSTLFNTLKLKEVGCLVSRRNLYEDVVAVVRLAALCGRADVYDVKASFRVHPGNMGAARKVLDWCEDSLYLLDIMYDVACDTKKEEIKSKGIRYFCRRNYVRASEIDNLVKRFTTYVKVSRKFKGAYPLAGFIYRRQIKPKMCSIRGEVKKALLGVLNK